MAWPEAALALRRGVWQKAAPALGFGKMPASNSLGLVLPTAKAVSDIWPEAARQHSSIATHKIQLTSLSNMLAELSECVA